MKTIDCPPKSQLSDYALGRIQNGESDEIESHLETCEACRNSLQEAWQSEDKFLLSLRQNLNAEQVAGTATSMEDPRQESTQSVQHPQMIRDYRILGLLGQGGMGAVYLAQHERFDSRRKVALKLIRADRMNDEKTIARFHRETKAMGAFKHPNVVAAIDAGDHEGQLYLVMEYVDGSNLSTIANYHGSLAVADACEAIRQAACGLQHACDQVADFVHRDIKPANLLINREGVVKVADLGLVRAERLFEDDEALTASSSFLGTLDFVAPEQIDRGQEVDIRTDIYSLGASLYKLLAGDAPFSESRLGALSKRVYAISHFAPRPLSELRPNLPENLVHLVDRMLAKRPEDRPQSPAEVAELLEPFCGGADLVELVAQTKSNPEVEEPAATSTFDNAPSAVTDTDRFSAVTPPPVSTKTSGKEAAIEEAEEAPRRDRSERFHFPPPKVWVGLALIPVVILLGVFITLKTVYGELILDLRDAADVSVTIRRINDEKLVESGYQLSKGDNKWTVKKGEYVVELTGPDATKFELTNDRIVVSTKAKATLRFPARSLPFDYDPVAVQNGEPLSSVALVQAPAKLDDIRSWTIATRQPFGTTSAVRFSRDKTRLATGGEDGVIRIWSMKDYRFERLFVGPGDGIRQLEWSPDNIHLVSTDDEKVRIWNTGNGRSATINGENSEIIDAISWSNFESKIAYSLHSGIAFYGTEPFRIQTPSEIVRDVCWSPDGKELAAAINGRIVFYNSMARSSRSPIDVRNETEVYRVTWSPDGKMIAARGSTSLSVWNVLDGEEVHYQTWNIGHSAIDWSESGDHLAVSGGPDDSSNWGDVTLIRAGTWENRSIITYHDEITSLDCYDPENIAVANRYGGIAVLGRDRKTRPLAEGMLAFTGSVCWSDNGDMALTETYHADRVHFFAPKMVFQKTVENASSSQIPFTGGQIKWEHDRGYYSVMSSNSTVASKTIPRWTMNNSYGMEMAAINGRHDLVASAFSDGKITLTATDDIERTAVWHTTLDGRPHWVEWSHDGSHFAVSTLPGNDIFVFNLRSKEQIAHLKRPRYSRCVAWHPLELKLFFDCNKIYNVGEGTTEPLFEDVEYQSGAWSPKGDYLALSDQSSIVVRRLADPAESVTLPARDTRWVHWSPAGDVLAYSSGGDSRVYFYNFNSHETNTLLAYSDGLISVTGDGHVKSTMELDLEERVVFVVQTDDGQETLSYAEFVRRTGWENNSDRVGPNIKKVRSTAQGMRFDGSQYVEMQGLKYDGTAPITIETYATVNQFVPHGTILSNGQFWQKLKKDEPRFEALSIRNYNNKKYASEGSDEIALNRRYHLAMTIRPKANETLLEMEFFVNGKQCHGYEDDIPVVRNARSFLIGVGYAKEEKDYSASQVDYPFDGWIDSVRISKGIRYSQDFTPQDELSADDSTFAFYRLTADTGGTVDDLSGNGFHALVIPAKIKAEVKDARPPSPHQGDNSLFDGPAAKELDDVAKPIDTPTTTQPMSLHALVSQPQQLSGSKSWTLETKRPRGEVLGLAFRPDGKQYAVSRTFRLDK